MQRVELVGSIRAGGVLLLTIVALTVLGPFFVILVPWELPRTFGKLLFLLPEILFPFQRTWNTQSPPYEPIGFHVDLIVWLVVVVAFGILFRGCKFKLIIPMALATIAVMTVLLHSLILLMGWDFSSDFWPLKP